MIIEYIIMIIKDIIEYIIVFRGDIIKYIIVIIKDIRGNYYRNSLSHICINI